MFVAERTGAPLPEKEPLIFPGSPEYWTDWILAYVSWYLNMDFETLQRRGISAERICQVFHPLHEADVTKTVDLVQRWLEEDAATVLRLSQVLACRAEDILSYSLELQPHPPIP